MRVIAGKARSMPLKTPQGTVTRPTSDRIKETLFNMLQPYLLDCVFVDLFAGSGGIGIEALSRGARKAYFIDHDGKAIECIQDNLQFTKMKENSVVLKQDVTTAISCIMESMVDVIYIDPPYQLGLEEKIFDALSRQNYVTTDTIIMIEADLKKEFAFVNEFGFTIIKEKKYKTNKHVFLEKNSSN